MAEANALYMCEGWGGLDFTDSKQSVIPLRMDF